MTYFLIKLVSFAKMTCGPLEEEFSQKRAEGDHRSFLRRKLILLKNMSSRSVFCADYEYDIYFC
jgi:hypothetical protein